MILVAELLRCCVLIRRYCKYMFIDIHEAIASLFVGYFTIFWDKNGLACDAVFILADDLLAFSEAAQSEHIRIE